MTVIKASDVYEWFFNIVEQERRVYRPDHVHVSELTTCLRKSYWSRTRVEKKLDVKNIILMVGNGVHRALQEYLVQNGWSAEVELKLRLREFWLIGHADLVTPDNEVVELKTTSKLPNSPYKSHLLQLNAYLFMAKASKGYLIYIDKSRGLVRVFEHYRDRKLWDEIKKRAYDYWGCLKNKKLPRPEPSKLCEFCEWKWLCYSKKRGGGK